MRCASRCAVALIIAGLMAAPLRADVIPTEAPRDAGSKGKIHTRLVQLGVPSAEALARAQRLTGEEARFFAQNPDRVQVVGQEMFGGQSDIFWWEGVFGVIAITGVVVWLVSASNE